MSDQDGDLKEGDGLIQLSTVLARIEGLHTEELESERNGGRSFDAKTLHGGLTNDTVAVTIPAGCTVTKQSDFVTPVATVPDQLVVRRFRLAVSQRLHYDRQCEYQNSCAAAKAGISPNVLAFVAPDKNDKATGGGALALEYVEGRPFDEKDLNHLCSSPRGIESLVSTLQRLHYHCTPFANPFHPPTNRQLYEQETRSINGTGVEWSGYADLVEQVRPLEERLHSLNERLVPCHNDLLSTNFIEQKQGSGTQASDKLVLIDFELSGMGTASWELGNIASENELDDEAIRRLTLSYWTAYEEQRRRPRSDGDNEGRSSVKQKHPDWLASRLARVHAWSLISKVTWAAWGNVMHCLADQTKEQQKETEPFDFAAWSVERIRRANQTLATPVDKGVIQALLDDLQPDVLDTI